MNKNILMVSYGGGHANIIRCVYSKLKERKNYNIIILALTTAPSLYDKYSITYMTISQIARKLNNYEEIYTIGKKYALSVHNYASSIELDDTIIYYGIGMHDLIELYGEKKADELFEENDRKSFLPVATMECILKQYSIDGVVLTNSPRFEKAAGIAANNLKIPVLRINDLPLMYSYDFDCVLCVMNEYAKENALKIEGVNKNKIVVTGQPVFEEEAQINVKIIDEFKKELLKDCYDKEIVYFTSNGIDESEILKALERTAKKHENWLFVIKIHPNQEEKDIYQSKQKNIIISREEAKMFVASCDLAITKYSTTGLEAVLLDKPLIEVRYPLEKFPLDYAEMGMAFLAQNSDELEMLICDLLDMFSEKYKLLKENRKRIVNKRNSVENICKCIDSLFKKNE